VAHVALAHDTAGGVELGHRVWAVPDAVLATDTRVGRVQNDAGNGVLRVCLDRAAFDAVGVETVIAAHGEVVALGVGIDSSLDLADATPENIGRVAILFVARDLAGATPDALRHIEVEAVLFAFTQRTIWDKEGAHGVCGLEGLVEVCERHAYDGVAAAILCAFV